MNVYYRIDEFQPVRNAVVTTGTFDGVHLGHQQIISRLKETAQRIGGQTVLLTFFPHPRMVLFPERKQLLLNTLEEKIALLEKAGINHLVIQPFTREFSMLSSRDFIEKILVRKLGTKMLVIGYDHHFGKNREGSFEQLVKSGPVYGYGVEEIPGKEVEHVRVSSTRIRQALEAGDVETAQAFLGYRYRLKGTVVKGKQLGRTLGFPTANLLVDDPYKMVPADGVYAVQVFRNEAVYGGMLNIGIRPTLNGTDRTIEVNLFDFDGDLYGETIRIEFVKRLRAEQKFDNPDELKVQIGRDRENALLVLKK
ncbi:MAG TPA: bifunctional riboflavin kinase/FAD synthetase [Bacteroidia bacterium]|nr:bifunctional riboflavin kinase/FAD synthetase [Bacteroidia bacterium]